jgi:SAM-dependent methyltransferase
MIKTFVMRLVNKIGYKKLDSDFVRRISKDTLNYSLHLQYALHALKKSQWYLALAELKTAEFLGANDGEMQKYRNTILSSMPRQEIMNHNQYYRLKSLASELNYRAGKANFSVLDVGGGLGQLASFIPEASYCLADPNVNGISGINLPFPDYCFDYVVSCHVLEHIPLKERRLFLDQLLSKSKYGLILLNPFYIDGGRVEDRLKLVIDVTEAEWAKEHLECTLPRIEVIKEYARERNLQIEIRPNGTMTTTLALVFVDYFASKSLKKSDWEKVNKFFNVKFDNNVLDTEKFPTGYIVYLGWQDKLNK